MLPLEGKAALVTGGSRGIGAAIARALARAGADVAITYVRSADKALAVCADIESTGRRARAIAADAADHLAVERAVEQTAAAFGRLDILVNNAGIFKGGAVESLSVTDFDELMAVNVRAVFAASRAAAVRMGPGGRIITIGSNLAERVPVAGFTLYALSKTALLGLTKGLARDLGSRGITVNLVQPGSTDTDMNPADGESAGDQRRLMAIQRFAAPGEISGLIAWLAGPDAGYVTGATLTIDGGTNV